MELGDCGAAGRVFKGAESGGEGIARAIVAARTCVLLGHELEDGSGHWAPPGSDAEAQDHAISC